MQSPQPPTAPQLLQSYYQLAFERGRLRYILTRQLEVSDQDVRLLIRQDFVLRLQQDTLVGALTRVGVQYYSIMQIHKVWIHNIEAQISALKKALNGHELGLDLVLIELKVELAKSAQSVLPQTLGSMVESLRTVSAMVHTSILQAPQNVTEGFVNLQSMLQAIVLAWDIAFYKGY
jgi:hypothetical protein